MKSYLEEQERARQEQERVREAQYERDRDFIFRTLARIETRCSPTWSTEAQLGSAQESPGVNQGTAEVQAVLRFRL